MAIKINDIPPEGLALEIEQNLDLFETGTASTACRAVLKIEPAGGGNFHLSGRVQAEPELECSRCLKRFPYKIDSELNIEIAPVSVMDVSPEHELSGGELETEFYQGSEIEPLDFVKEQVLISIPMVPLHSPDCKGLCAVCGTDLNAAECDCSRGGREGFGPFSGLKDFFKKK
jgi:uncharacterized protein